jgi:hypothetical protein
MQWTLRLTGVACASLLLSSISAWAGPKIVAGPGANAGKLVCLFCFFSKTGFNSPIADILAGAFFVLAVKS